MLVNAVISDIAVQNRADMPSLHDLRSMAERNSPPGFEGFRPFTPGYYNFQRALMKHIVKAKVSTPILSGLIYTADMPDVLDKGRSSVAAGEVRQVLFKKNYVVPPEVGHTVVAMSEYAVVNITNLTEEGFVFCFLNAANEKVAGTISWTSTGY